MCIYQKMSAQLVLIILSCPHANNGNVIGVDRVLPSEYEKDMESAHRIFYLVWTPVSIKLKTDSVKLVPYLIFF